MTMPEDLGVVDLMIGFPGTDAREKYGNLRQLAKDAESKEMQFPAEYMFNAVPDHLDEHDDPVTVTLGEMDKYGVAIGLIGLGNKATLRALEEHPGRFAASLEVDPNDISATVEKIRAAHA